MVQSQCKLSHLEVLNESGALNLSVESPARLVSVRTTANHAAASIPAEEGREEFICRVRLAIAIGFRFVAEFG